MIIILLFALLGWPSLSFGMGQMIELRDSANRVVTTVDRNTFAKLQQLNAAFRQRPLEEIKQGTQVTYRILTGLPKEQIQGMLTKIRSKTSSTTNRTQQIKPPEMSINW